VRIVRIFGRGDKKPFMRLKFTDEEFRHIEEMAASDGLTWRKWLIALLWLRLGEKPQYLPPSLQKVATK
jgi:hypothetical protein